MAEEAKDQSESQEENQSKNEDNSLPYEPQKLRKHGKVNDTKGLNFSSSSYDDNPFLTLSDYS